MNMTPIKKHAIRAAYKVSLFLFLLIAIVSVRSQTKSEVAPPAKSDTYSVDDSGRKYRLQQREVAETNFRICGVDLAGDEEILLQAARLFGKAPTVSSGDASTGLEEACYRSATKDDNTYLVFGRGELDSSFILSSGSSVWKGNHTCRKSVKITRNVATDSGLHLGLTQEQVIAILGLATRHSQNIQQHTDVLIYSLVTKKKTDPRKLTRWWQQETKKNPGADRAVFLQNYEFYDLAVTIDAKFVDDSLTSLTVSWSGSY